jgi:NTP pyrophosphatase (non-canonical NTP hydrolase)
VKQGLYAENIEDNFCISRIIEEVYEMVDAFTKCNVADIDDFDKAMSRKRFRPNFVKTYNKYIKNTVQDEVADVILLISSFSKHRGIDLTGEIYGLDWHRDFAKHSIYDNAFAFAKNATRTHRKGGVPLLLAERLNFLFAYIIKWAETLGVDVERHLELKIKYNENRTYKHR